ncbi:hypothetical protein ILYODFUR_038239 [Ilyodon furcidens]|uniref:Secreted protein n=1 Tax=Ilyodon furcidens TaxID=33524 RepID=A0ABV0UBS9_9TELE
MRVNNLVPSVGFLLLKSSHLIAADAAQLCGSTCLSHPVGRDERDKNIMCSALRPNKNIFKNKHFFCLIFICANVDSFCPFSISFFKISDFAHHFIFFLSDYIISQIKSDLVIKHLLST